MSLPNYLTTIKSSGVYRFVWDKSTIPAAQATTMRIVVGYSEKGPFNTPVYVTSPSDFISIFGKGSKRLERRGVYFHRMALQALSAGPILALNIKPFSGETVDVVSFDPINCNEVTTNTLDVTSLYDTERFWALDIDKLPNKVNAGDYVNIVATDVKDNSCTIFARRTSPASYKNITFRTWYSSQSVEIPEYMEAILDEKMEDYFMEVYVFRGEFTDALITGDGSLAKYFDATTGAINSTVKNAFSQDVDALDTMSKDPNSNFVGVYSGIVLPYFKDANGNYISLDIKFNSGYSSHKMQMKLDESVLEDNGTAKIKTQDGLVIYPLYIKGYEYNTITKDTNIYEKCVEQLSQKGIYTALTNRVDVEYHYLVDTFDTLGGCNKKELFAIAKAKDNTFAIVNFPKMSLFVDAGNFDIDKLPSKFVMPGETEGASYGAYYTQLTFSDGTVKSVVPSAALVSNLFMEKWGNRLPYNIVAGPIHGRLSYSGLVGPDYNFGRSDLDVLEPMGVNAIVYVPRQGTFINSNQTAKQSPVSALSKVHIRELVIYLQNEIEHLLQSHQWELNTQTLRDTIKYKADSICENIKNNGGLYEYINICDETNNPAEVVDNEMIVLDTEIEPARGAGKMIHQLTIHKTGGLTSTIM